MCMGNLRAMGIYAVIAGVGFIASGCSQMNGYVMNESGTAYYKRGNYAMAKQEFQRAVADDPYNADYMHNLATAMKKQGDLAGAERVYRHALNINPSHQPAHHELAQTLVAQGRQHEALDLMQTWVDTQPYVAEAYVEKAWLQQEMGDLAGAEQTLRQALQVSPNHANATAQLGQIYQQSGRNDLAVAMYQRSLYSNWSQPEVQSRVATLQGSSTPLAAQPQRHAGVFRTYAPSAPQMAYAQPIPMATARYGTPQRVTVLHPLPTYSHVTGTAALPISPSLASTPAATPVASTPANVPVVAGQSLQPIPDPLNADPQHTSTPPQMAASLPVVSPF